MNHYFTDIDSPLGKIRLVATDTGLTGCYFHGQKYFPDSAADTENPEHPLLTHAARQLQAYFSGTPLKKDPLKGTIALRLEGSDFQQQVWQALLSIPYGGKTTYGELARTLGHPRSTRAVAAAIGRNPVSVFVPCHRVIGKNGTLTGYAGGIDRKRQLLELEHNARPAREPNLEMGRA